MSTDTNPIRACTPADFNAVLAIINDGAQAYRGVIPPDRYTEPYMSRNDLQHELDHGVTFSAFLSGDQLLGVMGIQRVQDVTLIRHAYVRSDSQQHGVGTHLLAHLLTSTRTPVLIGTWAAAVWAIRFYQRHGFRLVDGSITPTLLRAYWTVPERQIETSVVLASQSWFAAQQPSTLDKPPLGSTSLQPGTQGDTAWS